MTQPTTYTYWPEFFNPVSLEDARRIILTPEDDLTTDDRWKLEHPYFMQLIGEQLNITEDSVIVDYGCGIGRMAKELIDKYKCKVVGVDIAPNMRALSLMYVNSDNFTVMHPGTFLSLDIKCDFVISIWVLQHVLLPAKDLEIIDKSLKPNGKLFIVNTKHRALPCSEKGGVYINDEVDIRQLLEERFDISMTGVLDQNIVSNLTSRLAFYASYNKKEVSIYGTCPEGSNNS